MNQILIKFIYMQKIHLNKNINCEITKEKCRLKVLDDSKAFIEYSFDLDDIYKYIEDKIQIKNENY